MYCSNCGQKISKNDKFCSNCGQMISDRLSDQSNHINQDSKLDNDEVLFSLHPSNNRFLILLRVGPIALFLALWGTGFFGGFGSFILGKLSFFIAGFYFILINPIVIYICYRNTYEKTEYHFYNNRIEYHEGFFNVNCSSIQYKKVTGINMTENVIQKQFGLGTIVLYTASSNYNSNNLSNNNGNIKLVNIKNPTEVYEKVKKFLEV